MNRRLLLIFIVVCMLCGCAQADPGDDQPYVSASEFYAIEESIFAKQHYVDDPITVDLYLLAEEYVQNATINGVFVSAYRDADRIYALPVYGDYLEATDMAIYLFYKDGKTLGIAEALILPEGTIEIQRCRNLTEPQGLINPLSLEHCYNALVACLENMPDFEIMGVVYATRGYEAIYPVGKMAGSNRIQYFAGAVRDFLLVEPFQTIVEGRTAFREYREQKKQILNRLVIFPWETEAFYETGYIDRVPISEENHFLMDYDTHLAIPIRDELHSEGKYILHLLYYHNQLIAEVVVEQKNNAEYEIVWKNVATKEENGSYAPLNISTYEALLQGQLDKSNWLGQKVAGVAFKGELELIWQW